MNRSLQRSVRCWWLGRQTTSVRGPLCPSRALSEVEITGDQDKKGVVIGAYDTQWVGEYKLTPAGSKLNDESGDRIMTNLRGMDLSKKRTLLISDICPDYHAVVVAGLGAADAGPNEAECIEEARENVRVAAGLGSRELLENDVNCILVEGFCSAEAAAEGAALSLWSYDELKSEKTPEATLDLFDDGDCDGWKQGLDNASAQNLARKLEETPANILKPIAFSQVAIKELCSLNVHVEVKDDQWLDSKRMAAFLTMAKGASEPPLLLELSYCGGSEGDKPVVLVGKGVTFDSGGLNLKSYKRMVKEGICGMAGAAVVIGVMRGLACRKIPINVTGLVPLCENMPGGAAVKPGDVVRSACGKSILVEKTENEGEVILADVLSYAAVYKPCLVVNVASLCHDLTKALGAPASGTFSSSDSVWKELARAAACTGDRLWRLPLWKAYSGYVKNHKSVDITNRGNFPGGDTCTAAAFLKEFAPCGDFVSVDISGTGGQYQDDSTPYLRPGLMTGRPVRTLLQFLFNMACPKEKCDPCGSS